MANKAEKRLRIADILLLDMEHPTKTQCNLSRWFSLFKRRCRRVDQDKGENSIVGVSEMTQGMESRSFSLGAACGLLCVVAAAQIEVNKMVELRTQMELFLQNAKQELGGSKPVDSSTCFSTNLEQASTSSSSSSSDTQFSLQSKSKCAGNEIATHARGMDQLEAELNAELERLQLLLDSENDPQQQMSEDMGDEGDYSDEMLWGSGIAPLELERKLHLVLEARQEERIKELEDALQCAQQKLEDKEIEISWWRDTATLMSGHSLRRNPNCTG